MKYVSLCQGSNIAVPRQQHLYAEGWDLRPRHVVTTLSRTLRYCHVFEVSCVKNYGLTILLYMSSFLDRLDQGIAGLTENLGASISLTPVGITRHKLGLLDHEWQGTKKYARETFCTSCWNELIKIHRTA